MIPMMTTSFPSETASTSTSVASSRKRSIRTGWPCGDDECFRDEAFELGIVVADFHGASPEDKAGADQAWVADLLRLPRELGPSFAAIPLAGCREFEFLDQLLELLTVFGIFDRLDTCSNDGNPRVSERSRQIQWGLPTELNDHSIGLDPVEDVKHILGGERFEEQQVARVVIGTDRFRVAVDHDRFDTDLAECVAGMAAAVIEFDSLPDAVGATAEDHYALLPAGFVGGVSSSLS
jgi:hypothetical protein